MSRQKRTIGRAMKTPNRRKSKARLRQFRALHFLGQNGRCIWCQRPTILPVGCQHGASVATLEHLLPLALGGTNDIDNTAMSCSRCNNARGDQLVWWSPWAKWLDQEASDVFGVDVLRFAGRSVFIHGRVWRDVLQVEIFERILIGVDSQTVPGSLSQSKVVLTLN